MKPLAVMAKFLIFALGVLLAIFLAKGASAVELEPRHYLAGNVMGTWLKPIIKPPKGWIEDEEWTERYERVVLFEGGSKSTAKPFLYVRAHAAGDMPLEDDIKGAQESSRKKLNSSTIKPLPDITRDGKLPIKVFLYKNPEAGDQAFEFTAFIKDTDDKYPSRMVYVQVVASAPSEKTLESARPAFMELLANF